ncbi:oxidoreductase [Streptomyces sp. WAC07094]|uniref:oxidoreductase n=1 Tax=Streptomyces sp. WAC07094 TaxID=3072183 RepID=UPI002EA9CF64|nr:oxidoreductase [Streptomyces sp. WAC07094]
MSKTFLITGVSTGLGRAIATEALHAGHTVVGTLRDPEQIKDFESLAPGRAHGRVMDVTDHDQVTTVVEEVTEAVAPIDVLVNNAGYGVEGTLEEASLADARAQFDVNVFGVIAVTKAVLPSMRERRIGHVFFITSMGGLRAFAGLSLYHGSKYAVEGIADSLRPEVAPFGIRVTSVEPGSFRTDWAGRSMHRVERSIPDYDEVFGPIRENRLAISGNQLGDPAGAGRALLAVLDAPDPPGHLLLGSDAVRLVTQARTAVDEEFAHWHELSVSTDLPDGKVIA